MKKILLFIALCGALTGAALAERADSDKEMVIEADLVTEDGARQIRTLTGDVILTRGTLLMKAGKAVLRTDPEGYQFVTFTAAAGALVTYRQKRDGGDLWIEGQAERVEYDDKTEIIKLFSKAKLARLEGSKVTDEAVGAFISYDSRKEFLLAANTVSGESRPGAGRSRVVIQPANKNAAATPGK